MRPLQTQNLLPSSAQPDACGLRIGFLLIPDFTLLALAGFIDVLRVAADEDDLSRQVHCRWTVMTPDQKPVRSSCGLEVLPTSRLVLPTQFDYVVAVGGLLRGHARMAPEVMSYLRRTVALNVGVIGTCTGSFVLARAGLLEGRRCCVHHYHVPQFQAEFPHIQIDAESLFTVDGNRITCPGGASVVDLALHLIQHHCGRQRALKVICQLIIEDARRQNHPQARVRLDGLPFIRDMAVKRALLLMQRSIGSASSISDMCEEIGVEMKTLERRFHSVLNTSPQSVYRRMRLERARMLVEETEQHLALIAAECGFADASHLTRTFREFFRTTPSDLRRARRSKDGSSA